MDTTGLDGQEAGKGAAGVPRKKLTRRERLLLTGVLAVSVVAGAAYLYAFPVTTFGRTVILLPGQTVRFLGSDASIRLAGFSYSDCSDLGPNDIGIKPCEEEAARLVLRAAATSEMTASPYLSHIYPSKAFPYEGEILGSDYRTWIKLRVMRVEDYCETSQTRGGCFASAARSLERYELCDRIEPGNERDNCYYVAANLTKDRAYCDKIEGDWKARCEAEFRQADAAKQGDKEYCASLQGNAANDCWAALFAASGDVTLCDRMEPMSMAASACFREAAKKTGDESYCPRIVENDLYRDECWTGFFGDDAAKYCDRLSRPNHKAECWIKALDQTGDPTHCEKVDPSVDPWYGICWYRAAQKTGDAAYCDRIPRGDYRATTCADDLRKAQ